MIEKNKKIIEHLNQIADMLEMTEDEIESKKMFGYRKAAQAIEEFPMDVATIDPSTIKGIGESTGRCVKEFVTNGTSEKYRQLLRTVPPPSVFELTKLEGVGTREAKILYQSYGIKNIEDLEQAIKEGKIYQKTIVDAFQFYQKQTKRILYQDAFKIVGPLFEAMKQLDDVKRLSFIGSMRRVRPTVANADILCVADDREKVIEYFLTWADKDTTTNKVENVQVTILVQGFEVCLEFCEEEQWGGELFYLTGPKEYNLKNMDIAKSKQMNLSEYGLALPSGQVVGKTEKEICVKLGIPYLIPELRELAVHKPVTKKLNLVSKEDIKGDVHIHTSASELASGSVTNYAKEAIKLGYKYLAFTDYDEGLSEYLLKLQLTEIDAFKSDEIQLLKGIEVAISPKGNLRYEHKDLTEFDIVLAAVHSHFDLDVFQQTGRLVVAIRHPAVKVLVHPECSVYGKQQGLRCNWDTIFEECMLNNVALEISGKPERVGFAPAWLWRAKRAGVKFVLSSDAHSLSTLSDINYALVKARRSGIEKDDLYEVSRLFPVKD